jgi:hypothetical protein
MKLMSNEDYILDRSAWKTDDPQWVKARKQQWREIKRILEYGNEGDAAGNFYFVRKKEHKRLKDYFLTGYTDSKPSFGEDTELFPPPNDPLKGIDACFIFYIWFHPDRSQKNWEALRELCGTENRWLSKERTHKIVKGASLWPLTQARFMESIGSYPDEGTLYGDFDLEGRLYRLFCPLEGIYAPPLHKLQNVLHRSIRHFFARSDEPDKGKIFVGNPNHICRHGLADYVQLTNWLISDEGQDTVVKRNLYEVNDYYMADVFLNYLAFNIADCYLALEFKDANSIIYYDTANELLSLYSEVKWPPIAKNIMDVGREKADKELKRLERGR